MSTGPSARSPAAGAPASPLLTKAAGTPPRQSCRPWAPGVRRPVKVQAAGVLPAAGSSTFITPEPGGCSATSRPISRRTRKFKGGSPWPWTHAVPPSQPPSFLPPVPNPTPAPSTLRSPLRAPSSHPSGGPPPAPLKLRPTPAGNAKVILLNDHFDLEVRAAPRGKHQPAAVCGTAQFPHLPRQRKRRGRGTCPLGVLTECLAMTRNNFTTRPPAQTPLPTHLRQPRSPGPTSKLVR